MEGWLRPFQTGSKKPQIHAGKLGIEEIEYLKQAAKSFYQWRIRFGGGVCRKAAIALLNEVVVAIKESQSPLVEKELYRLMAELAVTASTMSWHAGMERAAQDYYILALRASYAGHDRLFGARVLAGLSLQMLYQNKPQDALDLIHQAQHGTRNIAGPQVKAMLYMRESWALSAMGCEAGFQRAIALSKEALGQVKIGEEPEWIAYCTEGELAGIMGTGLIELAKHNSCKYAEEASEQKLVALNVRGTPVSIVTALDYIGLAESRFLLKDTESAVDYTKKVIQVSKNIHSHSKQLRGRLADLHLYMNQHRHMGSHSVREVNAEMETLLAC